MAKANGVEMKWQSGTFGINCCVNAFSPNFSCRLAFCPDCFGTRTENNKEEKTKGGEQQLGEVEGVRQKPREGTQGVTVRITPSQA